MITEFNSILEYKNQHIKVQEHCTHTKINVLEKNLKNVIFLLMDDIYGNILIYMQYNIYRHTYVYTEY